MDARRQIDLLTCRFRDRAVEVAYQKYMQERHSVFDRFALAAGLVIYLSYMAMDLLVLELPGHAILLRTSGAAVCGLALLLVHFKVIRVRLDRLVPFMVVFLGGILNVIIFFEPSIKNNYFIGLIQIAVFISFMLRAGFIASNGAFAFLLFGYLAVVSNKNLFGSVELSSQIYFITMMFASCSAGIYILERYRRTLFLNARVIDEQNAQLARMVQQLEVTVSRKTALLKVFAHVMKTPVHQIVGFLQVARREAGECPAANSATLEYAEAAATDLRHIVEQMVDYHLVDNYTELSEADDLDLRDLIENSFYEPIAAGKLRLEGPRASVVIDRLLVETALKHISSFFADRPGALREIRFDLLADGGVSIVFRHDDADLSDERFRSMTRQLTAIENYLSGDGANPEMPLRIAARAMERAGGALRLDSADGRALRMDIPQKRRSAA